MGSCRRARVGRIAADRVRRILVFEHDGEWEWGLLIVELTRDR
jgi:hypothetical protein